MEINITDIVALAGMLMMLWKTFFSKSERQKIDNENIKLDADADKIRADTASIYEEVINKQLARIDKLASRMTELDEKVCRQEQDIKMLQNENLQHKETIRRLEKELKIRDEMIECFEKYYRDLAKKAQDAGIKGIESHPPCFGEKK